MLSDTIYLSVTSFTGYKETGQRDTKDGSGTWSGYAVRRKGVVENNWTVSGTWNTNGGYCFNYDSNPDSYTAGWDITDSDPDGLTGYGSSYGDRQ